MLVFWTSDLKVSKCLHIFINISLSSNLSQFFMSFKYLFYTQSLPNLYLKYFHTLFILSPGFMFFKKVEISFLFFPFTIHFDAWGHVLRTVSNMFLRVLRKNLRVLDKYSCIGQNPWFLEKIYGSLDKSLGLDKMEIKQFILRG